MSDHENMIHCPENPTPHQGNFVHYSNLSINQSTLDGLNALIHWLDGFEKGGNNGRVPGRSELLMFYRGLNGYDREMPKEAKRKLVDAIMEAAVGLTRDDPQHRATVAGKISALLEEAAIG